MSTSTSDKFNKIINCKEQIRKAINKKGSRVAPDVPLDQYATKINAIPFYEEGADDGFAEFVSNFLSLKTDASYLYYNVTKDEITSEEINYLYKMGLQDTNKANYMFSGNGALKKVAPFELNSAENFSNMFYSDGLLEDVDVTIGLKGNVQYPFNSMFANCPKLKNLKLKVRRTNQLTSTTNIYYMFYNTGITKENWNLTNFYIDIEVDSNLSMQSLFYNNSFENLSFLKNTKIKCPVGASWSNLFSNCVNLIDITLPEGCELPKPTYLDSCFYGTPICQYSDQMQNFFDTVDLSLVSSMNNMFQKRNAAYTNFTDLNLNIVLPVEKQSCSISSMFNMGNNGNGMNESKITYFGFNGRGNASNLFGEYSNTSASNHGLRTIDEIYLPYITSANQMFYYCYYLTRITTLTTGPDLTDTGYMFHYCYNLTDIPVFDTSGVTNFKYMFQQCNKLTSVPALDLGGVANTSLHSWNDSNNPYYNMVSGCPNLERFHCTNIKQSLDLSSSTKFTRDALLEVIGNLYDISDRPSSTLYLHIGSTNLAKLTSEDIALATAKGWTIN